MSVGAMGPESLLLLFPFSILIFLNRIPFNGVNIRCGSQCPGVYSTRNRCNINLY